MDKENLNGIPEEIEENEAPVQDTEEAAEVEVSAEEVTETEEIAEAEETDETAESAEEIETEDDEDVILCSFCGENEAAEGSDYCAECETKMLKRRIPFLAWVSGFAALCFSFVAFLLAFIAIIPSGYIALGDSYAKEGNWHMAYEAYADVSEAATQFNTYANQLFGTNYQLIRTGEGVGKRLVEAVANHYSPIDAYYFAENTLSKESLNKPFVEKYRKFYDDNYAAYMQFGETISNALEEKISAEKAFAELDSFKGKEDINDVFVNYYKFALAYELGEDAKTQLVFLRELEASAEASGDDYGWIYYLTLAQALYDTGSYEEAAEYADKILETNKTSYDAAFLKMKSQLQLGDKKAAGKTVAEFKEYSGISELSYFSDLLEIQYLRITGDYKKASALCLEAVAKHETVPETNGIINLIYGMENKLLTTSELNRQNALIDMINGDYDSAFSTMMEAYSLESQYAYYMQYSATLNDPKFYGTLYLSAKLLSTSDQMTEERKADVDQIIAMFDTGSLSDDIDAIIGGKKTVEEVLTKGAYDLI